MPAPDPAREARSAITPKHLWVLDCGARYWSQGRPQVAKLTSDFAEPRTDLPEPAAEVEMVALPDWAQEVGINGKILVDAASITRGTGPAWQRCNWIEAAWFHLSCAFERAREDQNGPILSYASRLGGKDAQARYDYAWANRIFLFMRRWAARDEAKEEATLFGPVPSADIRLTHDVDAVKKTIELRLKQSAFDMWSGGKLAVEGKPGRALERFGHGIGFAVLPARFETFKEIMDLEEAAGLRSLWHFYAGPPGFSRSFPKGILLDPAYSIEAPRMKAVLADLLDGGWEVGLHQSFGAWNRPEPMRTELEKLARAAGKDITQCRQHWLHFDQPHTWKAQHAAGLSADSTLGFNDRPGFRNGAALSFNPWEMDADAPIGLVARPMLFMDSHFYSYEPLTDEERHTSMKGWLDEVRAVGGEATVNWHSHTITNAYGWRSGFNELIELLR
ncbi:MAG: polysaccharide deacetylase family protein [Pseudomonadota bacterium]